MAAQLDVARHEQEGLEEHHRRSTRFMSQEHWLETVANFFQKPDERIFGEETVNEAKQRFAEAVTLAISNYGESIAIVSHARVMSLFVAEHNNLEPWQFWQNLKIPDLIELNSADLQLQPNQL